MRRALLLSSVIVALVLALSAGEAGAAEGEPGKLAASTFAGALTAGPDGNVWFTALNHTGSKRVVGKVDAGGTVTEYEVPSGEESIVTGADGNLWFPELNGIGTITPAGQVGFFGLPAGTGRPLTLTAAPDGNVWFVTARPFAVGRITTAGTVTMFPLKDAGQPSSIAAGPAGDLWFTEPKAARIGRITAAGKESEFPLPDARARPSSIALGADGNLWFADGSAARVGSITPKGKVTFFPVPTLEATDEVVAGPGGDIWFTAGNEIGKVSTAGKVGWPGCFTAGCSYPPDAMTEGPDGRLWVASGVGHCAGYCGGGSEQSYILQPGSVDPYESLPPVIIGVGPTLSPVRDGRTRVVIGCGEAAPCRGTLRLRALVRLPKQQNSTRTLSTLPYSLAAGAIKEVALPFPLGRWERLRGSRGFLIVDAIEGGKQVGERGFYFTDPQKGGVEKSFN